MVNLKRAVIFDVDGTLLNPEEGVCSAVNYVIESYGLDPISQEAILAFNGPPIQDSFSLHYSINEKKVQMLVEAFRERYKNVDLYLARIYKGIYDLMDNLCRDGIVIGIATYKRQDYAIDLLRHFEFDKYTSAMYGADNFNQLKKKDIVRNCLKNLLVLPENAVMIGDSDNDAIAARELGMDFLGVTYGFGFTGWEDIESYNPIGCANSPNEIYPLLKKWYGGR